MCARVSECVGMSKCGCVSTGVRVSVGECACVCT